MRFTKIPLIATLMAVALSLLIVLPGLAQTTAGTDGKLGSATGLQVGVFDDITDAQMGKLTNTASDVAGVDSIDTGVYIPADEANVGRDFGAAEGIHSLADASYLARPEVSPQDTFFNRTLYVSNQVSAFNTVLINVANSDSIGETCVPNDATTQDVDELTFGTPRMTATVKNNRSGGTIVVQLVRGDADNFQAFFKVVEDGATGTYDPTPADTTNNDEVENVAYGVNTSTVYAGPTWCDDEREFVRPAEDTDDDSDPATPANDDLTDAATNQTAGDGTLDVVRRETQAATAVYGPVQYSRTTAPPDAQEIATLFARHGDRLTVTTTGSSGQIELTVDGDGPDFSSITPDDDAVARPSRLTFSFEVRDDDSGLRHDGEPVTSPDGDSAEINPDGDQHLGSEPLSEAPGTSVATNGPAEDIDVNVKPNLRSDTDTTLYTDISASGTWTSASTNAGVAYSFTASGAGRAEGPWLYQLKARDRAGNETVTDATDDPGDQPFVFRIDDTEPDLATVRTGISYDTEKNEEEVDRSYIALTFSNGAAGADALGDVDTSNITVVGHTIVGFIHPRKAPRINRGDSPIDPKPPVVTDPGTEPTTGKTAPADPKTRTDTSVRSGDITLTNTCTSGVSTPTSTTPGTTTIAVDASITDATSEETAYCKAWDDHRLYLIWTNENTAYEQYVADLKQYNEENPGTDIEGEPIIEPRSRVYIELSEDLASDATPTVLVVGGAVYDLAGNTNDAETIDSAVEDWIAPGLTVTVTGTANDRPVANDDDGSFTVDVRSDEDMNRRPVVYFVSLTAQEETEVRGADTVVIGYEDYTVVAVDQAASLTQAEDENHWSKKYRASSIDLPDGMIGVIVVGEDASKGGNIGATDGWSDHEHQGDTSGPGAGDDVDIEDLDDAVLLVEVDVDFNGDSDPVGVVTPRSDGDGLETESANPFVKLTFDDEGSEYKVCPTGGCTSGVTAFGDSHDKVTVTEITLDGVDAMANLNRVNATQFSLVTRDLELGKHKVVYSAVDDAGNEFEDGEFEFEVKPREPYEIEVSPGWNLVSLPATPVESAIGDVLANNQYISPVLGYQEGDWITAIREEDGTWRGRLETIEGGFGYWVHARTFESIETMLSEVDPAGTLPTVPVTAGWNLLGVLDIFQNDEGDAPGTAGDNGDEADNYFSSIPWKVAYSYLTSHSLWVKAVPGSDTNVLNDDGTVKTTPVLNEDGTQKMENGEPVTEPVVEQEILNGRGYWVWSPTPGTLVP